LYGSSSESAAWAELLRNPHGVDAREAKRRIGRLTFDVVALDLTAPETQRALGVTPADLTADDIEICQTLADLAADAGFEAVLGPSAAAPDETTLAVFGSAIARATDVVDNGVATAPVSPPTDSSPRRRR